MQETVTIASLELENVKRVRAVALTPAPTGLTVIGGDNRQGKTSVLDGICYALGGEKYRPTALQRDGGQADARIEVRLSNGLVVERKGKNASLRVTDPTGQKAGQKLLDSFVDELALNMPKFLGMSGKDKADVLLRILGIGERLAALEREERAAYDERTAQGRIADQKAKYAKEMPEHHDAPEALVSAAELVRDSQAVLQRNAERAAARNRQTQVQQDHDRAIQQLDAAEREAERLQKALQEALANVQRLQDAAKEASKALVDATAVPVTVDESTADIERRMGEIEVTNAKVRANLDKRKAIDDAAQAASQVQTLTTKVEAVRARRRALLDGAAMPLPGLSVDQGELTYNAKAWDCMSGAEQIRAGVAIVRKLKPACGFVLLDGLEAMDLAELGALGDWLQAEGLQAIATRVSRGNECSIVIEDGLVVGQDDVARDPAPAAAVAEW